ncbi:Protein of unknown function (plasmid) [Magnetospira sp. QH-2]|nr:Protein of unknown function [Magnetospira sp. QH-2]
MAATSTGKKPSMTYLTAEERNRYSAAAAAEGVSLSKWMNIAMEERARRRSIFRISEWRSLVQLRNQMLMAGSNINQVTRRLHVWLEDPTKRAPDAELLEMAVEDIHSTVVQLAEFMRRFTQ